VTFADDVCADVGLGVATEEDAVRQYHRAFTGALERADDVQEKSVVTIFPGWHAICKTLIKIIGRVKAITPRLAGEGRIGYCEVECLEVAVLLLKVRAGERIVLPDFGC